jgi:hypothetical protein
MSIKQQIKSLEIEVTDIDEMIAKIHQRIDDYSNEIDNFKKKRQQITIELEELYKKYLNFFEENDDDPMMFPDYETLRDGDLSEFNYICKGVTNECDKYKNFCNKIVTLLKPILETFGENIKDINIFDARKTFNKIVIGVNLAELEIPLQILEDIKTKCELTIKNAISCWCGRIAHQLNKKCSRVKEETHIQEIQEMKEFLNDIRHFCSMLRTEIKRQHNVLDDILLKQTHTKNLKYGGESTTQNKKIESKKVKKTRKKPEGKSEGKSDKKKLEERRLEERRLEEQALENLALESAAARKSLELEEFALKEKEREMEEKEVTKTGIDYEELNRVAKIMDSLHTMKGAPKLFYLVEKLEKANGESRQKIISEILQFVIGVVNAQAKAKTMLVKSNNFVSMQTDDFMIVYAAMFNLVRMYIHGKGEITNAIVRMFVRFVQEIINADENCKKIFVNMNMTGKNTTMYDYFETTVIKDIKKIFDNTGDRKLDGRFIKTNCPGQEMPNYTIIAAYMTLAGTQDTDAVNLNCMYNMILATLSHNMPKWIGNIKNPKNVNVMLKCMEYIISKTTNNMSLLGDENLKYVKNNENLYKKLEEFIELINSDTAIKEKVDTKKVKSLSSMVDAGLLKISEMTNAKK